jgi:glycosyltransferase involved in cell wall biosynthesis
MHVIILGVPHTKTVDPAVSNITDCAFTMKVWNLCRMMKAEGHEVVHLGTEGSNPDCSRNIDVMSHAEWNLVFGKRADTHLLKTDMPPDYAHKYNSRVRAAIVSLGWTAKSAIVCLPWGGEQLAAVQGIPQFIVASGIGNFHPFASHRVYESYANLHAMLDKEDKLCSPQWYHVVIPNGIDPALFGPIEQTKKPFALFMGRIMENKGLRIAVQTCRSEKIHLKIAGPGFPESFLEPDDDVECLGIIGANERRELMRTAVATFAPSYYVEPFGNVAVEAAMSGCPVIATDFGAFTEHVIHGHTGFRCRTMDHFRFALRNARTIRPDVCQEWAKANYSLGPVGKRYTEFFEMILDLQVSGPGGGWYRDHPERKQLDWMTMDYSMFGGGER